MTQMTLNEIATFLHKEYDIPYRKALSIAAKMIKEGAFDKPREEVETIAKAQAGVEEVEWNGGDDISDDGSNNAISDEEAARQELEKRFNAIGKQYLGEVGLIGMMAGALEEILVIALEDNTATEIISKLNKAGYDDEYFQGLFSPSDESWKFRGAHGRIQLNTWISEVENMMRALGIAPSESLYLGEVKRYKR